MQRLSGPVSGRIVQRVATTSNTDELDLPPLYDAVDPDALNALVDSLSDGEVSFAYAGHEVTVTSDESITVDAKQAARPVGEVPTNDD